MHISNNMECNWSDAQFAYDADQRKVIRVIDCTTCIRDEMEFQNFPFDIQVLPIKVSLKHDASDWEFVPFGYDEATGLPEPITHCVSVLNKKRINLPDFDFLITPDCAVTEFCAIRTVYFDADSGLRSSMSQICLHVPIERRSAFYVTNNFGIMFLITSTTFLIWRIDVEDVADRFSLDFTLLLTIVAFKLVQAGLIPAVSYLTILDNYTFLNFVVLLLASSCHCIGSLGVGDRVDKILGYVCASLWILLNLWFVFKCNTLSRVNYEYWKGERGRYISHEAVWYLEESSQSTSHKKEKPQ